MASSDAWAGCCFDHYVKYLRQPSEQLAFGPPGGPPLQMLRFDRVVDGCQTFCSIGLNRLFDVAAELCSVVDAEWAAVPELIAQAMFTLSTGSVHFCRGMTVTSLERIDPTFVERTGKNSLYIAEPNFFPPQFHRFVCDGEKHGTVWFVMFISAAEYLFVQQHGPNRFEQLLESKRADPFVLSRPSVA
jgi:hypothetical protein